MYAIEFTRQAAKDLRNLPKPLLAQIHDKLQAVAANPHGQHNNAKKLVGQPGFRLRIGDWRVVYELEDDRLVVLVVRIAPRGQVYKR